MGRGTSGTSGGGSNGSSGGGSYSGGSGDYNANNKAGAVKAAQEGSFRQTQDVDYNITEKDGPATMKHYDEQKMTVTVDNGSSDYYAKNYSVSVEHRVLADNTELYAVSPSGPHVRNALESAGHSYTRGARGARNRSGYLFDSRSAATSAARKAMVSAIRKNA